MAVVPGYEVKKKKSYAAVRAWGKDVSTVFEQSALGLFSVLTDTSAVNPARERRIDIVMGSREELLSEWLEMLVNLHEIKRVFYSKFKVTVKGDRLEATVRGERIDPRRHESLDEIISVMEKGLEIGKAEEGWEANFRLET